MNYWLDLFTVQTHGEVKSRGQGVRSYRTPAEFLPIRRQAAGLPHPDQPLGWRPDGDGACVRVHRQNLGHRGITREAECGSLNPSAAPTWHSTQALDDLVALLNGSLGGNIIPVENLAESLQIVFDAGKRILLPLASVKDISTIPGELFAKFQIGFYADPVDAVFKALGVQ